MENFDDTILRINYLQHLPENRNSEILDLGCGTGRVLKFLHFHKYNNFIGIDLDSQAIELIPSEIKNKTKLILDLKSYLSDKKEQFDCIIAKDVLYYIPRHEVTEYMKLISQSLRPNGKIIAEVFNGALLSAPFTAAKDAGIQTMYTEQSLKGLLEAGNMTVTHVFGQIQKNESLKKRLIDFIYKKILSFIFVVERGFDENNPKIFTKSIIAVARKK